MVSQAALLEDARRLLRERRPLVALTGAGISAECGIPPFRGKDGLWEKYPPEEYATIEAFRSDPAKVWTMLRLIVEGSRSAEPGEGHRALARMEELGWMSGVITQNVDGLHQRAGSRVVAELHGDGRQLRCTSCGNCTPIEAADLTHLPPLCAACGGVLRPDVVLFGEMLPESAVVAAGSLARECRCLLVIGTSCEVYPAALYPMHARAHGATILEINPEPSSLSEAADLSLRGRAGDVLPAMLADE